MLALRTKEKKKVATEFGKEALTDVLRARLCVNVSGGENEQHRRDVRNGCTIHSRE